MVQCRKSFSGCNTMNVTTHSNFSMTFELLSMHEDASIVGRPDMTMLLKQKVDKKQISPLLADNFVKNAKNQYYKNNFTKYTQGSTYLSLTEMIKIQLYESSDEKEMKVIKDNSECEINIHIDVKRP